ncbi:diguanylate cyclase (GGDEF) domain-containing protein [Cryptosporangium aurantiacum]|uniref:Diguanylate cyclase (GGDEF) domain-containing protein n=1 Tax=Cryptosporangium aurantiacum TaxID=134849 RepID=A0A1M7JML9_9ACTN|nr:diguanylate cyclase (GGDEF) domain-containing protein [Cryptosporangium aurantiacum]
MSLDRHDDAGVLLGLERLRAVAGTAGEPAVPLPASGSRPDGQPRPRPVSPIGPVDAAPLRSTTGTHGAGVRAATAAKAAQGSAGYEILGELGRGSRTVAYRVRRGDGVYAMKVARDRVTGPDDDAATAEAAERAFRREAALLACVAHPGLARVHEVGTADGRPYLVMDLVDGDRLADVLADGALGIDTLLAIGIDVADALAAAHRAGLMHRDIKPENIIVQTGVGHVAPQARVIDFGMASRLGAPPDGTVAGTMLYCAPEQSGMLNRPVDGRADLYALGAVLFECATGAPPFDSDDVGSLLRMHATVPAPDPLMARRDLPPALGGVIAKLLAKDPDDRYQSGDGLVADLRRLASGEGAFRLGTADRPTAGKTEAPLVGRDAELGALAARWQKIRDAAADGTAAGGAALVTGPPGSGKSRLTEELTVAVTANRGLVLYGKCDADSSVPLAPLREAFDRYVAEVLELPPARRVAAAVDLTAAAGPAASLLHGLSPGLGALLEAAPLVADDRDQPLPGAVAGFLAGLARSAGGLVLHLDDLHWMDDATGRVLRQLADELPDAPVLVLATARDGPGHESELDAVRAALGPALDLTIRLEPLPADAVAELVRGVTGGIRISAAAAAALAARSDGNPFTLLQFLTAIVDAGLARPSWGTWQIDSDLLHDVELPVDAVALVLERLRGLDDESRQLLGVAAALGPHFDPGMVAEVGRIARRRAIEVASAAAWRHLLERRDGDNFQFLHDRIREALLGQFDPATLRSVHARIADVLTAQDQSVPATVYALARHRQLADDGRPNPALFVACTAAGRLALAEQAPAEAVGFLEQAAAAATRSGHVPDAQFLQALGRAQHRTGRFRDALATLEAARARTAEPLERARLLALTAQVHDSTWATDRQSQAVDEALLELGRPLPDNPFVLVFSTLWQVLAGLAIMLTRIGYGTVREPQRDLYCLLTELYDAGALAYARQLRPTVSLAFTLRRVFLTARIGRGPESARMAMAAAHLVYIIGLRRYGRWLTRRAHRTAEDVGDPQLTAFVDWLEALDEQFFGFDQGERVRAVLANRARWLDAGRRIDLLSVLCWDTLLRGDVGGAEEVFTRRQALVEASDGALNSTVHACNVGLLALQGRPAEAAAQLARARADGGRARWERVDLSYVAMLSEVEQGDCGPAFDEAVADLEDAAVPWWALIPIHRGLYVYQAYGRLEQVRVASKDDRARRLAQARAAVRALGLVANTPMLRAHHRVTRAGLLLCEGRTDRALRALNTAEPVLRAVDAPLVAFETARIRARALQSLGADGERDRQARYALALAVEQRWPHRARQLASEFGLDSASRVTLHQARSSDGVAVSLYRQRLDAIQQVGLAASRVLDPARVAAVALDETIRILGAERAYLFLVDDTGRLRPHGGRDAARTDLGTLTGYSATLVERVWQSRTAMVVTGTEEGAALGAESVVLHGLRSIMAAPILLDGRLLGVVYLDSRVAKGIFTADDVGVLTAITSHVAVALETARAAQLEVAVGAANRQRDLAETLRDALAAITGILEPTPEQVLRRLLTVVFGVVGGDSGWLIQAGPEPPLVWVRAASRTGRHHRTDDLAGIFAAVAAADGLDDPGDGLNIPTGSHPVAMEADARLLHLLETAEPAVSRSDAPRLVTDALPDARCWLALPLVARDERLGVLLFATGSPDDYDDGVAEIAGALVGQGMVAYENARLFAEVRRLATIDGLTGVANRRHFFELATQDVAVSRRDRAASWPIAAMMIDIDHFKQVNDEHGHQVGDEVIQVVAGRLRQNGRGLGLLGRYGGEEFALLLRAGPVEAARVAEQLRAAVAEDPVPTSAGPLRVTISLGVTYLRDADLDADPDADTLVSTLLGRADRCLYLAKHAGRNRVHVS